MPKRSRKQKKTENDPNILAKFLVDSTTEEPAKSTDQTKTPPEPEKNPAAVALGRLGGLKGGKARAEKLTPKERSDIAKKAARSRWEKKPPRDH